MTAAKEGSASHEAPPVASAEAIRLAARLRAAFSQGAHVIQFTGVREGEGVTRVTSQMACALAQVEPQAVLLIDANLRVPGLPAASSASPRPGLVDVILGRAVLQGAIQGTSVPGLSLLPTGVAGADAVSLFASPVWTSLLREVRERFRFVIIDSPPLLSFADSALIAQGVDGVVVVVTAGQRRRSELIEAKRLLDGLKVNLIGVVLSQRSAPRRAPHVNGAGT